MLPPEERRRYGLSGSEEDRPLRAFRGCFVSSLLGEVGTVVVSGAATFCISAADTLVILLQVLTADVVTGDRVCCGSCQSMLCEAMVESQESCCCEKTRPSKEPYIMCYAYGGWLLSVSCGGSDNAIRSDRHERQRALPTTSQRYTRLPYLST